MPPFSSSWSWVPHSVITPSEMEMMRLALRMVLSRWAMIRVVRPRARLSKARWILASVTESSAEVASSKIRMGGFFRNSRAMAMRCFWPPESSAPRSPT